MEPELSEAAVSTSTPKQAVINGQSGTSAVQGQLSEGQCETQLLIASPRTARAAITQRQSLLELHTVTLIKLSMAMRFCRTSSVAEQELRPAAARTRERGHSGDLEPESGQSPAAPGEEQSLQRRGAGEGAQPGPRFANSVSSFPSAAPAARQILLVKELRHKFQSFYKLADFQAG